MVGTGIVTLLVAIYIVANVTCIAYFRRRRRADFNVFLHLVVPILGVVAFIPPWLTAAGIPVFSFIPRLAPPVSYAGPAVAVWMVLGLVYLAWLYLRHPARVADVSRVHFDEESGQEPGGKPTPAPDLAMPA
jgi:amino acid transporter